MPTSTTRAAEAAPRRRGQRGFTLLELSLVLLILGVMLTLLLPRLRDPGRTELDAQARRLTLVFRLLRSEAVLDGAAYRLNFDLDRQRYWATPHDGGDLTDFAREMGALARGTQLAPPVGIVDIVLPTLVGKIAQGQVYTVFYPDGSVDPTVIHLSNGRETYTLWLNPMNGRLYAHRGYQEVEYAG